MSVPVTKVEFGFTQSGGAYVFNDVTSYVRSVETNRGRANNYDAFDAGSAQIVLDNRGREFDPTYLTPTTTRTNLVKNPIPSTSAPVSPQETWQMLNRGTGGAGTTTLTADGAFGYGYHRRFNCGLFVRRDGRNDRCPYSGNCRFGLRVFNVCHVKRQRCASIGGNFL